MADGRVSDFLRQLGGGALAHDGGALSDGQLLERFLRDRDGPAFEALLRRHAPMVLGVCRRVVGNTHDAEDAFQATFLALVHKAASVVPRELVGHWLYGVAYRTALNARRLAARRGAREIQVDKMPEREVVEPQPAPDLRPLLDRELSRLPEVYRVPVVLCDLGGKPRQEVARQLSVPEGTVSSRLARGRELLRKRLVRRGLMLTGAALGPALADAASAAVPPPLLHATLEVGVLVATGRAAGAVSAPVACLLRVTLRQMVVARLRVAALVLLAVGLLGAATGLVARQVWPRDPPQAAAPAPRPVEVPRPPTVVRFAGLDRPGGPDPTELVNVNGTLFFAAKDGANRRQLWKIVPKPDGPQPALVKSVPGGAGLNPQHLTGVNGTLFFVPGGSREGRELWKSDGTEAGTVCLKRFNPPGSITFPETGSKPLIAAGRVLFFVASDGDHTHALWKSDGTAAGTVPVKDLVTDALTFPRRMAEVNGTLFFVADDGVHGAELWKSDGTAASTVLVKDVCPGRSGAAPLFLTNVNGTLFFTARDGTHGRELWKSDGTEAGTVLVKDINPGPDGAFPDSRVSGQQIGNLTAAGGTVFFAADDGVRGRKLWKSDGTAAGTVMVKDVSPGTDLQLRASSDAAMAAVNGTVYFVADDGTLWKSDGTAAGTVPVKRVCPNKESHASLTNVNGTLFVVAVDYVRHNGAVAVNGYELWKSDGTAAGTVRVQEINPGRADGLAVRYVGGLTTVGDSLYFGAGQPRRTPFEEWWVELWQMPAPRRPSD
jgi:RNA polymerase sigma factor (sigma-70 family)